MNLNELEIAWRAYHEHLDNQIRINRHMLSEMRLERLSSSLDSFGNTPLRGMLISVILLPLLLVFIYHHASMPAFILPAALIAVFVLLQLVFSLYQALCLRKMCYGLSVVALQKKLAWLAACRLRYLVLTRFAYAFLGLPVLIVGAKWLWDYNLYLVLSTPWLVIMFGTGLAFLVFALWLSYQAAPGKVISPWMQRILANIRRHDINGRALYQALDRVKTMDRFTDD